MYSVFQTPHKPVVEAVIQAVTEALPGFIPQEEGVLEPLVKEEAAEKSDCNLDLKVELNIRSERGLPTGGCSRRRTVVSVTPV